MTLICFDALKPAVGLYCIFYRVPVPHKCTGLQLNYPRTADGLAPDGAKLSAGKTRHVMYTCRIHTRIYIYIYIFQRAYLLDWNHLQKRSANCENLKTRGCRNIKTSSYWSYHYMDSHYKDKTVFTETNGPRYQRQWYKQGPLPQGLYSLILLGDTVFSV